MKLAVPLRILNPVFSNKINRYSAIIWIDKTKRILYNFYDICLVAQLKIPEAYTRQACVALSAAGPDRLLSRKAD